MKFEKFFKSAGTHGAIVKKDNASWLICAGIGMKIPEGVNNLGLSRDPDELFRAILAASTETDILTLKEALLFEPDGKTGDIIRVFETDLGDRVGIYNAAYGLLEKKDKLTYLEIEHENEDGEDVTDKFIVVLDYNNETVGFINGTDRI